MGYISSPLRARDTEQILRTAPPPEIGAYLFIMALGTLEPLAAQAQKMRTEPDLLSVRLGGSPQLERKFKGRYNTGYVYRTK